MLSYMFDSLEHYYNDYIVDQQLDIYHNDYYYGL